MAFLTPHEYLPYGYATSSADLIFVSSSEFRVDTAYYVAANMPLNLVDFEGVGTWNHVDSRHEVDLDNYVVEPKLNPNYEYTRIYISHIHGPFSYPSWKQVRHEYKAVYNALKRDSNLVILNSNPVMEIGPDPQHIRQVREKLGSSQTRYNISYMSSKFRPLLHGYKELVKYLDHNVAKPVNLVYDYSNLLSYFPIEEIDNKIGVEEKESLVYNSLYNKYSTDVETNIGDFRVIRYSEIVWPKDENTYLDVIRSRPNFVFNWRDKREDRTEILSTNTQGKTIKTGSIWPLDAREGPYRTATLFTTASTIHYGDVGELMGVSSIYHNGTVSRLTASALFSYPMPDSSSYGVFFTNDTAWKM